MREIAFGRETEKTTYKAAKMNLERTKNILERHPQWVFHARMFRIGRGAKTQPIAACASTA